MTGHTYTPANLLSTAGGSSMTWDAAGNRITFTSSTDVNNSYTFVYDPTAGIPAIIEETHAGTSVYYIREPGGALIARVAGSDVKYYGFDDLGSTLFLTDSTGIVTDKYTYDAWGNSTSYTGSTQQPYQYVGQMGYYAHWQDIGLNFILLGVRGFYPGIGRFMQSDPIRAGIDSYMYADDRPVISIDPWGLVALDTVTSQIEKCMASPIPLGRYKCLRDLLEVVTDDGSASPCAEKKIKEALDRVWRKLTANDAIQAGRNSSIRQKFPGELLDKTVEQIEKFSRDKKSEYYRAAKTAWKLLNDNRWNKCR